MTDYTFTVRALCAAADLPEPEAEYAFARSCGRRWRFDFAWPGQKLAMEINGGMWTQGRHVRGAGAIGDMRKFTAAATLGWKILYYLPEDIESGIWIEDVKRILEKDQGIW